MSNLGIVVQDTRGVDRDFDTDAPTYEMILGLALLLGDRERMGRLVPVLGEHCRQALYPLLPEIASEDTDRQVRVLVLGEYDEGELTALRDGIERAIHTLAHGGCLDDFIYVEARVSHYLGEARRLLELVDHHLFEKRALT